ncbi:DUF4304 domain-containing protein [Chryseobacterium fluminis]|uniref:DUF4304 domain-containing protein n=1 Tax=Chryseobacterium fluminis TaxID=2983606 RepID=UPI00225B50F4|nr:DUF4304 domain-containing protein [Chryseobacterium sp. MMS21-Ot14]UZT99170.1 DUF4304 domain-containing protein [Chryseobacterium sp. MMS21-Ot14]
MNSKEFKNIFGNMAKENGFLKAFSGWYKESPECIAILELQKSNFGDYYMLNIKIFIQGSFDRTYSPTKELIKSPLGHVNANETDEYRSIFNFDQPIDDSLRIERLRELFKNHIVPFTTKTSTRAGIKELESKRQISILPVVKKELEKLMN